MRHSFYYLIFLLTVLGFHIQGQSILEKTNDLENTNGNDKAVKIYQDWLLNNKNDSQYPNVLTRFLRITQDKEEIKKTLTHFWREEASYFQEKTLENICDYSYKFSLLTDDLELLGFIFRATENTKNNNADYLFYFNVQTGTLNSEEQNPPAISYISQAAEDLINKKTEKIELYGPAQLFQLYHIFKTKNLPGLSQTVFNRLSEQYPDSPEFHILYTDFKEIESNIRLQPTPENYFSFQTYSDETMDKDNLNKKQNSTVNIFIQLGSYKLLENANYMKLDLEKAGFRNSIIKNTNKRNQQYFIVMIPTEENRSQSLITKLKEKGFEGFLIKE